MVAGCVPDAAVSVPPLHIVILAAGAASRMRGGDKLLEPVDGTAQLTRIARAACATGCPVWVALPPGRPARDAALAGLNVTQIVVDDAALGLSASMRAANRAVPPDAALMLLLADLPEIDEADLRAVTAAQQAHPADILRATAEDGTPGHPVIFPPWARADLAHLTGDEGARTLLRTHAGRIRPIALPDCHATTDLDTPEDWAEWRARTGR